HGSGRNPLPARDLTCIANLGRRNQTTVHTDVILCKTKVALRNRCVAQAETKRERQRIVGFFSLLFHFEISFCFASGPSLRVSGVTICSSISKCGQSVSNLNALPPALPDRVRPSPCPPRHLRGATPRWSRRHS